MPQVIISRRDRDRPNRNRRNRDRRKRHPKMIIRTEGRNGVRIAVPYAPKVVDNAGLAPTYTETGRPGRMPLLLRASDPLHSMSFELFLGHPNSQQSVENELATLRAIARSDDRVILKFGPSEGGLWRVTQFGWTTIERKHGSNAITRATVAITFTRASDAKAGTGPVKGGARPQRGKKADEDRNTRRRGGSGGRTQRYVVKRGDSLTSIAYQFYRDTSRWREIADANDIRRPRKLKVGKKLVIP